MTTFAQVLVLVLVLVNITGSSLITTDDVIDAIRRLPGKQSAADPIPTSVLKQIADVIAPFIVEMFNRSLSEGHFPAVFKEAFHHSGHEETGT